MEDYEDDNFDPVTPSDQISEVPMIDYQGKVDSMFEIEENRYEDAFNPVSLPKKQDDLQRFSTIQVADPTTTKSSNRYNNNNKSASMQRHISRSELQKFNMYVDPILENSKQKIIQQSEFFKSNAIPKIQAKGQMKSHDQ